MTRKKKHKIALYDVLDKFFKDKGWSKDEIKDFGLKVKRIFPHDRNWKNDFRTRSFLIKPHEDGTLGEQRKERNLIRALNQIGVPLEYFDIPEELIYPKNRLNPYEKPVYLPLKAFESSSHTQDMFIKEVDRFLSLQCKNLTIMDYLGRGARDIPGKDLEEYFKSHSSVFDRIENKIINEKITYNRILGLHILEKNKNMTFKEVAMKVLWQSSVELFVHLCNCLSNPEIGHNKAKFHITSTPSRLNQVALMKHSEFDYTVYEESYSFNEIGDAEPSHLLIHKPKYKNQPRLYKSEIKVHFRNFGGSNYFEMNNVEELSTSDFRKCFCDTIKNISPNLIKENSELREILNRKIEYYNRSFGLTDGNRFYVSNI